MKLQSELELNSILSPLDWFVFTAVLVATIGLVVWGNLKLSQADDSVEAGILDYLLMGRRLTLPLFIGTLVATWYGGIFGVTQIAFEDGVYNFITQGAFWYITYILFALFLVQRIRGFEAVTLPDLVSKMVGKRSGQVSAIFNVFNVIPITYAISIGLLIQALFGSSMELSIVLGVSLVLAYSFFGGFRAVVFSDLAQFFVMCSAVLFVLLFSLYTFGGISFLQSSLPSTHFEPLGKYSLATTLVWGFIALSTLVDPNFYQRCFAANSTRTARIGILCSTVIWFGFDICTTLGGMYARAVIPEAESGTAYLTYAVQVLPDGFRGFLLAGVLATILSTLDSYLFVASTTLTHDLGPQRWKESVWAHRIGVLTIGIVAIVMSFAFEGNIRDIWKTLGSYSAACLLFPLLFAYWKPSRIGDAQFLPATISGAACMTYWRFADKSNWPTIWSGLDDFYIGLIVTTTVLGLAILMSRNASPSNVEPSRKVNLEST